MKPTWTTCDHIRLLENGEAYFPRVYEAIAAARRTVLLETFILFEDAVGKKLHAALADAARRGVRVLVTVDGYGSPDLSDEFVRGLVDAGVQFRYFSPRRPLFGVRTNLFRRLHRKLVAIDRETAFIGGINFSVEHLYDFGPLAKQDYAVEVDGALAREIHDFLAGEMGVPHLKPARPWLRRTDLPPSGPAPGAISTMLATRDNDRHRTDIEREYLRAIRTARHDVLIANAYFLPGYRLIHALCEASRRGVSVRIVMQGKPDMPWVRHAAVMLYEHMQDAGVRIFEYCERPFHGKVAVVDDWATVGSSNLDPLSLSLNLEANVAVRDRAFARELRANLDALMARACREIPVATHPRRGWLDVAKTTLMFHVLRRFPAWTGWLPAHAPTLVPPRIAGLDAEDADAPQAPGPVARSDGSRPAPFAGPCERRAE